MFYSKRAVSSYVNRNLLLTRSATITITIKVPLDTTLSPTNPVHIFHTPFLQHINIMLIGASLFVLCTSVNMTGTINRDGLDERKMYVARTGHKNEYKILTKNLKASNDLGVDKIN